MKATQRITVSILFLSVAVVFGQDITFTNKVTTFTNLQGQIFANVHLIRGDLDGLIWRSDASGGRVCYTNLNTEWLTSVGISSNRVEIARARAAKKAISDARYRALVAAEAEANKAARELAIHEMATEQAASQAAAQAATKAASLKVQQKADAERIQQMQARYDALDREKRHNLAAVMDGYQRGQDGYINYTAIEQLEDFRLQIQKARNQYFQKYGSYPPE